jgi:HAD superfamily hydrolase (TIGR01509 family)
MPSADGPHRPCYDADAPMQPFDLVIFDNDGVLVDSEWHANGILADLLTEFGLACTREDCIRAYMGSTMARVRTIAESRLGRPLPAELEDRYHARLFEIFRTTLTAVPGVTRALEQLATPTCVASSGTHERIRLALTTTGLLGRFDGRIFSAQDVARGKPAPDLFLHAAAMLQVTPARCAVIEDSPLGVEAANRAGMIAFGFARMTPAERLRDATGGVFESMDELPALLAGRR